MKYVFLPLFALSFLAACGDTYPVSQCTTEDHYPVACQEIGADDHPGDIAVIEGGMVN